MTHAAPAPEPEMVTATDGIAEVVEMPRALFDSTYAPFGWALVDTSQPDPQWPTEDLDANPWFTHTPAEETS